MARPGQKKLGGILVGDGDYFWTYWPEGKFRYPWERSGKYAEEYEKYQRKFFMKKRTPVGKHSLGHEIASLGRSMTILDPSTFHGYTDSLQAYINGVRSLGTETVGGEVCDGIEVSIMKHQRSWDLWLARKDRLPRKLKQVIRVGSDITGEESWSEVVIDADIPNDRFAWSAPQDWKEWKAPDLEEGLLKPGAMAPDFELATLDGGRLKLSSFRGQIVWLNKWRCGRTACREETGNIQKLYEKYHDQGLVVGGELGGRWQDRAGLSQGKPRELSDHSRYLAGWVASDGPVRTLLGVSAVPMTYVIGRDGKIVDAWYGYASARTQAAREEAGAVTMATYCSNPAPDRPAGRAGSLPGVSP